MVSYTKPQRRPQPSWSQQILNEVLSPPRCWQSQGDFSCCSFCKTPHPLWGCFQAKVPFQTRASWLGRSHLGSDAETEENMTKEARGVQPGVRSNWLRFVWLVDIHRCCWKGGVRAPPALRHHIFLHMDAVTALLKEVINLSRFSALSDGAVKHLFCSTLRGSPKTWLLREQPTLTHLKDRDSSPECPRHLGTLRLKAPP